MPAITKELKWGEDNPVDHAPVLTEQELDTLKKKQVAFDRLLAEEGKAKYKIEVLFKHTRRVRGLSFGALSIWESGTKLHGGGDTKMYWCPGKELKVSDCVGIIPDASNGYGHLVCPDCKRVWQGEQVFGEIFYGLDAEKWSIVILRHYIRLGSNADIYLKYPRHDLRVASGLEQAKQLMGEKLAKVRKEREQYIYPLARIMKDVAAGSDLQARFKAFLTA
jgi:hypothetical protein